MDVLLKTKKGKTAPNQIVKISMNRKKKTPENILWSVWWSNQNWANRGKPLFLSLHIIEVAKFLIAL